MGALNGHIGQSNPIIGWVWYKGSDALLKGEAVCNAIGHGTATDKEGRRHNAVERPTAGASANSGVFAGVAARDYGASAGGQFVEIYRPGSEGIEVAVGAASVTIGDRLCFTAGSGAAGGRFVRDGLIQGRGTARIMQTKAICALTASAAAGMSLATDGVTLTHTAATGDNAVLPGDTLVILAGSNAGTNRLIQPGRYTIGSVTSTTVVVLAATPALAALVAAGVVHGYIMRGNPTVQADLLTGEETGGVEFICPANAGGATVAMRNGLTCVLGGVTLAATATYTLADGRSYGNRKGFLGLGTLTTNGFVVTVTNGIRGVANNSPTTALASFTVDAAAERVILDWNGLWCIAAGGFAGATLA